MFYIFSLCIFSLKFTKYFINTIRIYYLMLGKLNIAYINLDISSINQFFHSIMDM